MQSVTQTQTQTKFQCGFLAFVKSQGLKPIKYNICVWFSEWIKATWANFSDLKRQKKEAKKETF